MKTFPTIYVITVLFVGHVVYASSFTSTGQEETRDLPLIIDVPDEKFYVTDKFFKGREEMLKIAKVLLGQKPYTCGICGQGGVGKTTLVVKLVHQLIVKMDLDIGVFLWIKASSHNSFIESMNTISEQVHQDHQMGSSTTLDFERISGVQQWVVNTSRTKKICLVIDDYHKSCWTAVLDLLVALTPVKKDKICTIVTSQERDLTGIGVHVGASFGMSVWSVYIATDIGNPPIKAASFVHLP
jgi:hypothetical protein